MAPSKSTKSSKKIRYEKGAKNKLSVDFSSFIFPVSPDLIKATAHFKVNKRRTIKMLQRVVTPQNDFSRANSWRKTNNNKSGEKLQSKDEFLSTSKYRKVAIILNGSRFGLNGKSNSIANKTNANTSRNQSTTLKKENSDEEVESHMDYLSTPKYKRVYVVMKSVENNNSDSDANDFATTRTSNDTAKNAIKRKQIPSSIPPPEKWESLYSLVEELRQDRSAPVDQVGAEILPERHRGDVVFRFQVLILLMLNNSQPKDKNLCETVKSLQKHGLDVENIQKTSPQKLDKLLHRVAFHSTIANYIKQTADILIQDYGGDIPSTVPEIQKLPGVGPKMSYILETIAFDRCTGIGVDTHMHRIFNQIGFVQNTQTPEQTRVQLESWLPKEKWPNVNLLFVGFGQECQQQKQKMLTKALSCTRPKDALDLLRMLGFDVETLCARWNLELA